MSGMSNTLQTSVHTYAVGQPLTQKQFQAALDRCYSCSRVIPKGTTYCNSYTILHSGMEGIRVALYDIPAHQMFRVSVIIEPCRALGKKNPTALYHPTKKTYKKLVQLCDKTLKGCNIPGSIDDMSISRVDATCNLLFDSQQYVDAYLRILKKGCQIRGYRVDHLHASEKKAKDAHRTNLRSFCIRCKQASFLAYDKIDQLTMIGLWSPELENQFILRLEAQLRRPALKSHLKKQTETNLDSLTAAANQSQQIIVSYLKQLFPYGGDHLCYDKAVELICGVQKEKLREEMLYLLRKASDCASLSNAEQKLLKKYGLSKKQLHTIRGKFHERNLSPITLPNSSKFDALPSLAELIL